MFLYNWTNKFNLCKHWVYREQYQNKTEEFECKDPVFFASLIDGNGQWKPKKCYLQNTELRLMNVWLHKHAFTSNF